jgi:hypothetical protein
MLKMSAGQSGRWLRAPELVWRSRGMGCARRAEVAVAPALDTCIVAAAALRPQLLLQGATGVEQQSGQRSPRQPDDYTSVKREAGYWQPHPPVLVDAVSQQPSFASGSQQDVWAVGEQQPGSGLVARTIADAAAV